MSLSEEFDGECEDDFVQFGRDVFFITSYRSVRYCGLIRGDLTALQKFNKSEQVTPMKKRIYSESDDMEMDIWVKITVPAAISVVKSLEFVVTAFKKSCALGDSEYARCGQFPHCIRSELFCDGVVNCALPGLAHGLTGSCGLPAELMNFICR